MNTELASFTATALTNWTLARVSTFVRINNMLNRSYVGSVIVDDGNSRYFEPGPGFGVLGGVNVTFK